MAQQREMEEPSIQSFYDLMQGSGVSNRAFTADEASFSIRPSSSANQNLSRTSADSGNVRNNAVPPTDIARARKRTVESIQSTAGRCGYGSWSPEWLQRFHGPCWLLFSLSLCSITQGLVINGLVPISITTLEKRFNLNSFQTGLFSGFYDVAVAVILIPVCHYGNHSHKGRWLGWGVLFMSIGSFICASPQFTTGNYLESSVNKLDDVCNLNGNANTTISSILQEKLCGGSNLSLYLYIFLLGQVFHGFGASPLYTLGVTFIDESVSQRSSPLYLGLYTAFSTIGPAVGFIMGGMFLRIYGDFYAVDYKTLGLSGPADTLWYGAWWIGFIFTGICFVLFSLPVLCFASRLPGSDDHRLKDIDQTNTTAIASSAVDSENAFSQNFSSLPGQFWALLKNPTYTCLIVMQTCEAFILNAFITFVPKLFENLFNFSSSKASLIAGAIVVPCGFIGNVFGGWLIRHFRLRCRKMILLAIIFNIASTLLVFVFLLDCPESKFAGVNQAYSATKSSSAPLSSVVHECNQVCDCDLTGDAYKPVCDVASATTFYSPCRAGCRTIPNDHKRQMPTNYSDCGCLPSSTSSGSTTVIVGACSVNCGAKETLFLVLFGALVICTFCSSMPVQQCQLRCVRFNQRTMAVGFGWVFMRVFGSIPGPLLLGVAIDRTCSLWLNECGVQKNCLKYNTRHMSLAVFGFGMVMKTIIVISLFVGYYFYSSATDDNEEQAKEANTVVRPKVVPIESNLAIGNNIGYSIHSPDAVQHRF